jgi:hypothetical protein
VDNDDITSEGGVITASVYTEAESGE